MQTGNARAKPLTGCTFKMRYSRFFFWAGALYTKSPVTSLRTVLCTAISLATSLSGLKVPWFDGSTDRWFSGLMDRWFDSSMDRWFDGSMDRWFHGSLVRCWLFSGD